MVIRNLTIFFVVVFWLATAYWVYKDARRRIEDPWLVAMATILGLVPPFIGPIIYLFFRPPEYLEDVRERELEIRAMEERLARRDLHCPVCRAAGRGVVPRLPGLHDAAQAGVRQAATRRSRRSGRSARTARRPVSTPNLPGIDDTLAEVVADAAGVDAATTSTQEGVGRQVTFRGRGRRAHPDPDQARRDRAGPRRRDPRPDRAPRLLRRRRRSCSASARSSARSTTPSTARSRSSASSSTFITSAPTGRSSSRARAAIATMRKTIGRDEPGRRRARHDPRRLRDRDAEQPRPRLGLARVGAARDRALVRRR